MTPLMHASYSGHVPEVELLLKAKAEVNVQDKVDAYCVTDCLRALKSDQLNCVRFAEWHVGDDVCRAARSRGDSSSPAARKGEHRPGG
jgi:ankyrin repeat protein